MDKEMKEEMQGKIPKEVKVRKKGKKGIFGKIMGCILILLLVLLLSDICITEIYARKIPHRFASADEGKNLLLSENDYYGSFTQNDIEYRMTRSGATLDELLEVSAHEVKDFTIIDKYLIDRQLAKMARKIKKNGYDLPSVGEVVYIKTDMIVENGICRGATGYTHGTNIYLNSVSILTSAIPEAGDYFESLMWHEYYHCLSRNNPEFRKEMYSLINFTVADEDFEMPPSVQAMYVSNPDVEHHDSYATFNIGGKDIDCYTVTVKLKKFADVQSEEDAETVPVLVPIDGTDTYYIMEKESNYQDVFGKNTDYVDDPEECMAKNFSFAMQYGIEGKGGEGYPNPEIIQGVIDIVSK